jgi:hypothetical protein
MMDCDLQSGHGLATETALVVFPLNATADGVLADSEQEEMLGLNVDHSDPLAWINFWPG